MRLVAAGIGRDRHRIGGPLGEPYSVNGTEIGGLFSPSGKSWLFARDVGEGRSGELLVVHEQAENWPPACPAASEK